MILNIILLVLVFAFLTLLDIPGISQVRQKKKTVILYTGLMVVGFLLSLWQIIDKNLANMSPLDRILQILSIL